MHRYVIFIAATLLCLLPFVTTPTALLWGLFVGLTLGVPNASLVQKATKWLLQISVVGLGFAIPISEVMKTGLENLGVAVLTITLALLCGFVLAYGMGLRTKTATLITIGTGICGGSAIAAVAPTIKASAEEMGIALAAVFSLNAIALFLFPLIGHTFQMSEESFGLWSALAIHDTSSVVGAASVFGEKALKIATTVKLSRVIFLIPIVLFLAVRVQEKGVVRLPWFIGLFALAAFFRSTFVEYKDLFDLISQGAKQALCVVLFWVGAGLNRQSIKSVGVKPFAFAVTLWIVLATASYFLGSGNYF